MDTEELTPIAEQQMDADGRFVAGFDVRENVKHNNPLYLGLNNERQLIKHQQQSQKEAKEVKVIAQKEAAGELVNGVNASLFDLDALDNQLEQENGQEAAEGAEGLLPRDQHKVNLKQSTRG